MALQDFHTPNAVETILDTRTVTPEQVLDLRRKVWPDGKICRREAEVLFEINDTLENVCGEWRDFFAETMVAHLVEQADPRGYISEDDAEWFCQRVMRDDEIRGETELETLIQLLEKAVYAPQSLAMLALNAVHDAVLEGSHKVLGNAALVPGVLDDPEVALLRRVLYAKAAGRSEAVSRGEAQLLFELNDATANADNAPAWTALFVNAISNYLLVQDGYEPPSRDRMKKVDLWLNEPMDWNSRVKRSQVQYSKMRGWKGIKAVSHAARTIDLFGTDTPMEEVYRKRMGGEDAAKRAAAKVDENEAAWLIQRIERDGALTVNEVALLTFLRETGLPLDPSLEKLMRRV